MESVAASIRPLSLAIKVALTTGALALPLHAQAANLVINTPNQPSQYLADGDDLTVTGSGSIVTASGPGVGAFSAGTNPFITNQAGGSIQTSDGTGIWVGSATTISGDISNEGNVSGTFNGVLLDSGSTVQGGVINSGTVAADGSFGLGVQVHASQVDGGISNSGSVNGAFGVVVTSGSQVSMGVSNTGTIDVNYDGMTVWSSNLSGDLSNANILTADRNGLTVASGSQVTGNVSNSGTLSAGTAMQNGDGISVKWSGALVTGDVSNSGMLTASSDGMLISSATVNGNLINSGTVTASDDVGMALYSGAVVGGNVSNTLSGTINAAVDSGIYIGSGSQVTGAVQNAGSINAQTGIFVWSATVNQGVVNSGSINNASNTGIWLSKATVNQGVINSGSITGKYGLYVNSNTQISGGINNQMGGTIDAAREAIDIYGSTVNGGISNAGTLMSGATYDALQVSSSASVIGGISNTGTLTGGVSVTGDDGSGGGIDMTNSGDIDVGAEDFDLSGDFSMTGGSLAATLMTFTNYTNVAFGPVFDILGDVDITGGDLLLSFDVGFLFEDGERLDLISSGGAFTGTFDNYADDDLVASFAGGDVFIDYVADGIELYSVASGGGAPAPAPASAALVGLGLLGWRLGRRKKV